MWIQKIAILNHEQILGVKALFKKTILITICSILLLFSTSCGNKVANEETVIVKESDNLTDYSLNKTALNESVEFSKDGISVTLDGILYEDLVTWFGFTIKNDTQKPIKVLVTDLSINGIMCTDSMLADIEQKSDKTEYLEISNEWFYDFSIKTIKELEFTIRILDENSNEIMRSDVLKATTDAPKSYVQQYPKDGFPVFNENGAVILSKSLKKSKLSNDLELGFYIENNTESHFSIMHKEVYVNDKPFLPTFIVSVGAGKIAVDSMLFSEKDLKDAKIEDVTSVKVSFKAIDLSSNIIFETDVLDIPVK